VIQSTLVRVVRAIFGVLTLVALVRQFLIHVNLGLDWVNFFSYYTILSNLFAGCVFLLLAAVSSNAAVLQFLRLVAVVNMVLVGIVFNLLLRNADVGALLPWVNVVHHYLMPGVVLLDWIVVPTTIQMGWRELAITSLFPLLYVIYSLVRGAYVNWYPYPFLNYEIAGGTAGVALYAGAITLVFLVVGWTVIALGNRRRSSPAFRYRNDK
jgi:hypothetical protein